MPHTYSNKLNAFLDEQTKEFISELELEISRVSGQMSDLYLEWQVNEQRTDELGVLGKSPNKLSQNLQTALAD